MRHAVAAGEPLNPEVIRVWQEATGTLVRDGYGQTETVNVVASYPCLPVRPGLDGQARARLRRRRGRTRTASASAPARRAASPCAPSRERPVGLMAGYWRDDEATAAVMRDGWYHTGDRGVRDEDGYLWFVSRDDDVIISASYRIGPFEVESALVEHPAVAESAVVAKPDPDRTAIVKAFVVLAPGPRAERRRWPRSCRPTCGGSPRRTSTPARSSSWTSCPRRCRGKIRRGELREREAARGA